MNMNSPAAPPGAADSQVPGAASCTSISAAAQLSTSHHKKNKYFYRKLEKALSGFITVEGNLTPEELWDLLDKKSKDRKKVVP